MADLIDRQDAIDTHCAICPDKDKCPDRDFICPDRELFRMIKPVHPGQPKIGRWIAVDSFSACGGDEATWEAHGNPVAYYYCSVCKEQCRVDEFGEFILSNYCPDCGARLQAKMEVGK